MEKETGVTRCLPATSPLKKAKINVDEIIRKTQQNCTRKDDNQTRLDTLSKTAVLLKSFQLGLNERMVAKEKRKEEIKNDIHALEYEIAKVTENIKTTEEQLKIIEQPQPAPRENIKTNDGEQSNQACMMAILEQDFERELSQKDRKLRENMEKKRRMEVSRMDKRIRDLIIRVKEQGKVACLFCGKVSEMIPVCGNCYDAYYCDEYCQQKHWSIHQYFCR